MEDQTGRSTLQGFSGAEGFRLFCSLACMTTGDRSATQSKALTHSGYMRVLAGSLSCEDVVGIAVFW